MLHPLDALHVKEAAHRQFASERGVLRRPQVLADERAEGSQIELGLGNWGETGSDAATLAG